MPTDNAAVIAGIISTTLFAASYLPMLVKAIRTRDLASYSASSLAITNLGNAVHTLYILSLPAGPIWALHGFYLTSNALMSWWWWRYRQRSQPVRPASKQPAACAPQGCLGPRV